MATTKEPANLKCSSDLITPHKITVSVLIKVYCNFRETEYLDIEDDIEKARYRRDFCVLILKLLQSPDLSLQDLRNILTSKKYKVADAVIESFETTIHNLYQYGIGNLLDIIDIGLHRVMPIDNNSQSVPNEKPNCLISRSSVVGYYLRRLIVTFEKLTFSEVVSVYQAFEQYCEGELNTNVQQNSEVEEIDDWYTNKVYWNKRQAELFITKQVVLLNNNEESALQPGEMKNRITDILKSNPSLAEAHFLSYLNYLRVKEFCGAIDSLYHCFDRSTNTDIKGVSNDNNKMYRFALLNFAILHYQFGHVELATTAIKEAIKVSQAANDNICLQHALSWFYRLTPVNRGKLMAHLVSKSLDLNMSYTMSLGIQSFVQYACLMTGNPVQIFEALSRSDVINYQHNLTELISNSFAINTCLWQFYGKPEMSSLWSQLLFYHNMEHSNPEKVYYGEGFCLTICNVANYLFSHGDYTLVNALMCFAKARFPNEPHAKIWMLYENMFSFTRALIQENWNEAEGAAQKIMALNEWEGYLKHAELYLYKNEYSQAQNCIASLTKLYNDDEDNKLKKHYLIRSQILNAEIQIASSFPDRVPMGIISLLTTCHTEINKYKMDYQSSIVMLHITNTLLLMGMTGQALKTIDRCLVQILAHAGYYDRARAMLLYVKCLVANSANHERSEKLQIIKQAVEILNEVKENFRKVDALSRVKDVLYFQAQLYNSLNMKEERNQCSREFKILEEEYTTKNYYTLVNYL